jgi:hypothetical protein
MKARITLVPTGVPVSLACSLAIISGRVLKVRSRTSCRFNLSKGRLVFGDGARSCTSRFQT